MVSIINGISTGMTIENDRLQSKQRSVALITILFPLLITILSLASLRYYELVDGVFIVFVSMHFLTMLGITVGYHRLVAHRAFQAKRIVKYFLLMLGAMSAQGPVNHWVANHRRHHQFSDQKNDIHSPHYGAGKTISGIRGFWHAHVGWMLTSKISNPNRYCKDLLRDKDICLINRYYFPIVVMGLLLPGVACLLITPHWIAFCQGVLWGGFVRMFTVHHSTWAINSVTHMYGSRPYDTGDYSANNFLLALPSAGEAWHNSHHAFPRSARFGLKVWQLDLGYLFILLFKKFGLVSDVKLPFRVRAV